MGSSVTRGYGLLEHFLAKKRLRMVEKLIPEQLREGRIVDIGCGQTPLFLQSTRFREKYGIDQHASFQQRDQHAERGITLLQQDLEIDASLPFPDASVDVVTMLAVFEHIERRKLHAVIADIYRVLRPTGAYILTTPAHWTDPILTILSKVGLLSPVEVEEHQQTHTHESIADILVHAGFSRDDIDCGTFELGMNIWTRARRASNTSAKELP